MTAVRNLCRLLTEQTHIAARALDEVERLQAENEHLRNGLRDAGVLVNDTRLEITGVLLLAPQRGPDGLEIRLDEVVG